MYASESVSISLFGRNLFVGAVLWGGGGLAMGTFVSRNVKKYVYSPSWIQLVWSSASLCILTPLGLARGTIATVQHAIVRMKPPTLDGEVVSSSSRLANIDTKQLWESMTFGTGLKGKLFRLITRPVLPSTTKAASRMQAAIDQQKRASAGKTTISDVEVVSAAAKGIANGILHDKKSTITLIGIIGFTFVVGVAGFGLDRMYRNIADNSEDDDEGTETSSQDGKASRIKQL